MEFPRVKSFEAEIIIMFRAKADHFWSSVSGNNFSGSCRKRLIVYRVCDFVERQVLTGLSLMPFSDFLLSNHLLNLRISTPDEMVMREIARKLGLLLIGASWRC